MEELLKLISTYGFPIVMCAWFMLRTEKIIQNNTKALNNNNEIVKKYFEN